MINKLHHVAIICSDLERSKRFYTEVLGFKIESENFRRERDSWKIDLSLNGTYLIELFSFPDPPKRVSGPEATGLRHLAFEVDDLESCMEELSGKGVACEAMRTDAFTSKRFTFIADPDGLPIEFYEK